ncbi:hypothetical protein D3C78_996290 [compost metagenome]
MDARSVRPARPPVGARHHPGHLRQYRLRPPRPARGRLRGGKAQGFRPQVGDARRRLPGRARGQRQTLVRPPAAPQRPARGAGDRRRPGRLRHGQQPGWTRLAGDPDRTPRRAGRGSLGQPAGRALPQALGPRHRAVETGGRRFRLHPPPARTPAGRRRLERLRRAAAGLRRQGSRAPGAPGRRLPERSAASGGCRRSLAAGRPGARTGRPVVRRGRLGPSAGAVPPAGQSAGHLRAHPARGLRAAPRRRPVAGLAGPPAARQRAGRGPLHRQRGAPLRRRRTPQAQAHPRADQPPAGHCRQPCPAHRAVRRRLRRPAARRRAHPGRQLQLPARRPGAVRRRARRQPRHAAADFAGAGRGPARRPARPGSADRAGGLSQHQPGLPAAGRPAGGCVGVQ